MALIHPDSLELTFTAHKDIVVDASLNAADLIVIAFLPEDAFTGRFRLVTGNP